jgi:hypothetical protein
MMTEKQRKLAFVLGCMQLRIIIALLPLYISSSSLPYYAVLLTCFGLSFLYLYFANLRLDAIEGGGITWWANFRILHASLYICAAIYAFQRKRIAFIPLLIDTLIGLMLFLHNHFW